MGLTFLRPTRGNSVQRHILEKYSEEQHVVWSDVAEKAGANLLGGTGYRDRRHAANVDVFAVCFPAQTAP